MGISVGLEVVISLGSPFGCVLPRSALRRAYHVDDGTNDLMNLAILDRVGGGESMGDSGGEGLEGRALEGGGLDGAGAPRKRPGRAGEGQWGGPMAGQRRCVR